MARPAKGAVRRAMTAAVEYGVARAGIAAVRALDHDVIGQAQHPRGTAGRVTAWEMAHRPSNRQRSPCLMASRAACALAICSSSSASLRRASRLHSPDALVREAVRAFCSARVNPASL